MISHFLSIINAFLNPWMITALVLGYVFVLRQNRFTQKELASFENEIN
jgi:hypothetical protein